VRHRNGISPGRVCCCPDRQANQCCAVLFRRCQVATSFTIAFLCLLLRFFHGSHCNQKNLWLWLTSVIARVWYADSMTYTHQMTCCGVSRIFVCLIRSHWYAHMLVTRTGPLNIHRNGDLAEIHKMASVFVVVMRRNKFTLMTRNVSQKVFTVYVM